MGKGSSIISSLFSIPSSFCPVSLPLTARSAVLSFVRSPSSPISYTPAALSLLSAALSPLVTVCQDLLLTASLPVLQLTAIGQWILHI